MQAQQKLFIIFWSAVVVVCIGLMGILYASLIPHFAEIGDWAVWVVRLGMICGSALMIAFTWFKIQSMRNHSRFVQHGEVVSYIGAKQPFVVSSIHEAAKIPAQVVPALPSPDIRWDAVLDLRKDGKGMHAIADSTKIPYNKVRDFLNQVEGNKSQT